LRSLSIVRSQDWRGRPLGRRQSTGRRSVDARSAREWSSEGAANFLETRSYPTHVTLSKFVGVIPDRFGADRGVSTISGTLGSPPLGMRTWWLIYIETCVSPTCLIVPISVILGQTVRALLWRYNPEMWPFASHLSRSLKVIGTDTARSATCDFLISVS